VLLPVLPIPGLLLHFAFLYVVLTVFVFEISSVDSKEQATQIRMQSLW
jgi:hypothetical protein